MLPIVIDNGTGYTKMGWAGNKKPQFVISTAITLPPTHPSAGVQRNTSNVKGLEDLDFVIGDEALKANKTHTVGYPIRHGQIDDWQLMESYWHDSFYKYLRCDPEDHHVLIVSCSIRIN